MSRDHRRHRTRPPRRPPEPDGDADGDGRHGSRLRGPRPGRLLVGGVLGRRDVRLLHPVPERGPLGAPAHVPQADAEHPAADAAARPEPAGLPPLRRHGGRPVRGEGGGERDGRVPRLRRAERHPQPAARRSRPCGAPASTRRAPSATPSARCTPSTHFVEMAEQLLDLGCDSICIKDMAALLKPQPAYDIVKGIKEACGEEIRVHVHVHATTGVTLVSLMKAIEAGADCVDTAISSLSLGPGHNPDREPGRDAGRHRLRHRAGQGAAARSSRSTSRRSGRGTRSSCRTSPASRRRSSTARFPAA